MNATRRFDLPDEAATERLAAGLAGACLAPATTRPLTIFLEGDLGAGKTALVRALMKSGGYRGRVKSPTYTLIESYPLGETRVHHLDLYRVGDAEELAYLGIRDLVSEPGLCLVEWPQRGVGFLPAPDLRILLRYVAGGRGATVSAFTPAGGAVLSTLDLPTATD